jgi:hypothetical protein
MAVNFHVEVTKEIIFPHISSEAIQHKAAELGLLSNSREDISKIKNAITAEILSEISTFLLTEEAQNLYSPNRRIDVKKLSPKTLFLQSILDNLDKELTALYPQVFAQQEHWTTRLWNWSTTLIS